MKIKRHTVFSYVKAREALAAGGFLIECPGSASAFWLFDKPKAGRRVEVRAEVRAVTARRLRGVDKLERLPIPANYLRSMHASGWRGYSAGTRIYMTAAGVEEV